MSDYTENLCIEPIELEVEVRAWWLLGPRRQVRRWAWRLTADLWWEIGFKGSGLWVCVKKGFITDLMSLPWLARRFMDRSDPETAKAGAVHDWLRPTAEDIVIQDRPVWDVQFAAGEFFHAMKAGRVAKLRRICCYLAVALFGTRRGEW